MKYISDNTKIRRIIKIWLIIGLVMIAFQVLLGGITRLTGSGLSITKWDIVVGSIPPVNEIQWTVEFDLYKQTPQYQKINQGMTLQEFKFIYFWEFIHRLWGRLMGLVFFFPFMIFWLKGMFTRSLLKDLIIVFLLAAIVASFGWIMVASGLIDRPWVNAYKLTLHLSLAFICYAYLLWTTFKVIQPRKKIIHNSLLKKWGFVLTVLVAIQIIFGGVVAGIKAGPFYPTWPDMNGDIIPDIVFNVANWTVENFVDYEHSTFLPALIQVLHRFTAYLLVIITLWHFYKGIKAIITIPYKKGLYLLVTLLITQVLIGILTVINCQGSTPLALGVIHQFGALLLLSVVLFLNYQFKEERLQ
jgi:cytochrome c oxidase assembly protein subunit 15